MATSSLPQTVFEEVLQSLAHYKFDAPSCTYITLSNRDPGFELTRQYVAKNTKCSYSLSFAEINERDREQRRRKAHEQKALLLMAKEGKENKESKDSVSIEQSQALLAMQDEAVDAPEFTQLLIGYGLHELMFEGHKLFVLYRSHGQPVGTNCGPVVMNTITLISNEGSNQEKLLKAFVEKRIAESQKVDDDVINIYSFKPDFGQWVKTFARPKRPLSSVVLPAGLGSRLLDDVSDFLTARDWYQSHGIPYKRSYLLFGPPGSGKTSLIQALAGHFSRNVCFLQPCDKKMTDDMFKSAVQRVPAHSIIVLEDIDAVFNRRRESQTACPLTFSGFINALDGVASGEGSIFMLTTNHPERLDPALVRAGRVDMRFEMPAATLAQIRGLFLNFYPGQAEFADKFTAALAARSDELHNGNAHWSMAALQGHFIKHRRNDAERAATEIDWNDLEELGRLLSDTEEDPKLSESEAKQRANRLMQKAQSKNGQQKAAADAAKAAKASDVASGADPVAAAPVAAAPVAAAAPVVAAPSVSNSNVN